MARDSKQLRIGEKRGASVLAALICISEYVCTSCTGPRLSTQTVCLHPQDVVRLPLHYHLKREVTGVRAPAYRVLLLRAVWLGCCWYISYIQLGCRLQNAEAAAHFLALFTRQCAVEFPMRAKGDDERDSYVMLCGKMRSKPIFAALKSKRRAPDMVNRAQRQARDNADAKVRCLFCCGRWRCVFESYHVRELLLEEGDLPHKAFGALFRCHCAVTSWVPHVRTGTAVDPLGANISFSTLDGR